MASLTAIREGVKATVEAAVPGVKAYDIVPDQANLPCVVVKPDPGETADFDVAMGRGTDTWRLLLYVLVSSRDAELAQRELDAFVTGAGPGSIRQAIFKAKTLGLADVDAHVASVSGYGGQFEVAQFGHVGAVLHLEVLTKGTE